MASGSSTPHVLIFPLPLQGPVNSMLKLAEIFCLNQINITFLNTDYIQNRLTSCTAPEKYSNFRFRTLPDGLPENTPRTVEQIGAVINSLAATGVPLLRQILSCTDSGEGITCLIVDGAFAFVADVAREMGVPLLFFDTVSPCAFWTYMCLPKLIESGEIPFKDDNLDEVLTSITGTGGIIRRRDLPGLCRTEDLNDPTLQLLLKEVKSIPLAQGLIFNTFEQLEAPILSEILSISPNIYAVGPLHTLLKARLSSQTTSSNSLWEEDESCVTWLDAQPPKSVVYVSIGSLAVMTKDQMLEIWHGLVNSGSRFLWAQRLDSIIGFDDSYEGLPELLDSTKERGYIVNWVPQEEVLAHPSIACFLTHSGWNSTLESIAEGKPMICWPHHFDQQVTSRFVEKAWRLGVDMKDTCDRAVVEKMIREMMDPSNEAYTKRADEIAKWAKASITNGGSSSNDMARLIDDIKLMKLNAKADNASPSGMQTQA